jgi:hypothetical protein
MQYQIRREQTEPTSDKQRAEISNIRYIKGRDKQYQIRREQGETTEQIEDSKKKQLQVS